jgi:nicotinate-nucleotide adenylyltransferase
MHVAIFGGSFDPPHLGHQMACLYVLATQDVDELWVVPVYRHAFGKPLAAFEHRLAMCRRLCDLFAPRMRVSDVERELGSVSRTAETLRHLRRERPGDRFSLVIGTDLLAERHAWYDHESLEKLAGLIVVGRSGHAGAEGLLLPEVSSTEVRRRLAAGEPCQHLVPRSVLEYVRENGLYRPAAGNQ